MTIQRAIELSIQGGYKLENISITDATLHDALCQILLDPDFFQCLGKSLRWDKEVFAYNTFSNGKENNDGWRVYWHRLIDTLSEGKSIQDYFDGIEEGEE